MLVVVLLVAGLSALLPTSTQGPEATASSWRTYTATPADAFLDTVGVATHKNYADTSYGEYDLLALLKRLNVRNIRDAAIESSIPFYRDFANSAGPGAGVSYLVETENPTSISEQLEMIASQAPGTASQIESQNEPDCNNWTATRAANLRRQAQEMRATMNQLAPLRGVPLTTPSFCRSTRYSFSTYGDDGVSSRFNLHPYPGGSPPGEEIDEVLGWAREADPEAVPVVTESGYHNAVNTTDDHTPVSELAAGTYLPQMLLEYNQRGVALTCVYELLDLKSNPGRDDDQENYGLFRADGSIKPAGASMAGLLSTLRDDSGPRPPRRDVELAIASAGDDLRAQPFVRSDGSIDLALWRAEKVWDESTRTDLADPVTQVTVRTRTPADGSYVRIEGVEQPERTALARSTTFTVPVNADVTILRLLR